MPGNEILTALKFKEFIFVGFLESTLISMSTIDRHFMYRTLDIIKHYFQCQYNDLEVPKQLGSTSLVGNDVVMMS